jgi:hypothetical protein
VPITFVDDGQASASLQQVAQDVATILTPSEEILYVALQNVTAMSIKKDSAVATSNRLILFRPSVFGSRSFSDFLWEDVQNVTLKDGMLSSELPVELIDGRAETLGGLDKGQARRFYGICQQKEQEWREKRRIRDLEEARARAGGIHLGSPGMMSGAAAPSSAEDPVEKLKRAKALLDAGLISEVEYETLKAKIIASLS